jgi:hypothetical protein
MDCLANLGHRPLNGAGTGANCHLDSNAEIASRLEKRSDREELEGAEDKRDEQHVLMPQARGGKTTA